MFKRSGPSDNEQRNTVYRIETSKPIAVKFVMVNCVQIWCKFAHVALQVIGEL